MDLLEELTWRGLIEDTSDPELFSKLKAGDACYVGFDPTAPSLHFGNLVGLILSMHLTRAGLKPLLLFGGATGMIGDPGGRSSERNLMALEDVARNVSLMATQAKQLWRNAGLSVEPEVVNNIDWLKDISMISFLRDIGKHFPVGYMLSKESVKSRISAGGISFTEFSYMLLQAYDFFHLHQTKNCRLEFGGSDQWGNITAGLEYIRRTIQADVFAFCHPLITDSEGRKFGKSAGNAVWLDPTMTSPYAFYQFWLNVPDVDVVRMLKIFTFETPERIAELENLVKAHPERREAQRVLADDMCTLVHGADATADAKRSAQALFSGSLEQLNPQQQLEALSDAPTTTITRSQLETLDMVSLLGTTVAKSKGEARRLVQGGGIYVDSVRLSEETLPVRDTAIATKGFIVLRSGKKNYHIVKLTD